MGPGFTVFTWPGLNPAALWKNQSWFAQMWRTARHSEYKTIFEIEMRKGFSTGYWAYNWTQYTMTQQKVHDLNTSSNTRKRLKTKVEVNKTKDTTHRRVTKTRDLSVREEPVSPGIISHHFLICDSHITRPSGSVFLKKPFSHFFSQRTPLYSSISHFKSLPWVVDG